MPFEDLLEQNKLLAPFTTLGIGGPARWFLKATTEEHVADAAAWAREKGIRFLVLGGGSNLVVSDTGFDGLVLRIGLRGIEAANSADGSRRRMYRVGAGEDWDQFVEKSVE